MTLYFQLTEDCDKLQQQLEEKIELVMEANKNQEALKQQVMNVTVCGVVKSLYKFSVKKVWKV